jgi:hypothetical protein
MPKSRKTKSLKKRSTKGLKKMGKSSKKVLTQSLNFVQKGIAGIYNTLDKGLNMGVKGVKSIGKNKTRKHRKTRKH